MVDSLLFYLKGAKKSDIIKRLGLVRGQGLNFDSVVPYALLTLYRPSNGDEEESFQKIVTGLKLIREKIPIIFHVYSRTKKQLSAFGLEERIHFHNI